MKKLYTLKDADVKGKRVLVRVDFNVPIDPKTGQVADDSRISATLPTLEFLMNEGAKIILVSHLGRPKGEVREDLRMNRVADALEKIILKPVKSIPVSIGPDIELALRDMQNSEILLLENVRFHPEEEKNDLVFAEKLSKCADIFVNDAFGTVHRAHASTVGVTQFLPSFAGFLLEKEIAMLSPLLTRPEKPFVMIVGGAKIDTKIGILKSFLRKVDAFLIGGALANTFLKAQGFDIGASFFEENKVEVARELMLEGEKVLSHRHVDGIQDGLKMTKRDCMTKSDFFVLPHDVMVSDDTHEHVLNLPVEDMEGDMKIFDIGKNTAERFCHYITMAKTIVWNGPLGFMDHQVYHHGTRRVAEALAATNATTIVGGGDTLDSLKKFGIPESKFTHVSTGGGAMLEFLEGKSLPGIEVLYKK